MNYTTTNRRNFLKVFGYGAASLSLPTKMLYPAASAKKPNVVIFYADDFGWGDFRKHNQNPAHFRYTPHMDEMFTEGIELVNYMTHCVCSPSRAGLLTGKHYANVSAGPYTGGTLSTSIRNFARDFQAANYKTGAFGKWHISLPNFPEDGNGKVVDFKKVGKFNKLHQNMACDIDNNIFEKYKKYSWGEGVNAYGFDRWVGYYAGGGDHFDHFNKWHHDADWWHDRKYRADERGYRTDLITKHAAEFIEKHKNVPFCCYVPHEAVHDPIQLKQSDLKEFCGKLDSELNLKGEWDFVRMIKSPVSGRKVEDVEQLRFSKKEEFDLGKIDPKKKHFHHLIYAAYCYTLDKSIGAIIRKVKEINKFENTIFVFASDNGATSSGINLPFKKGKHSLWDGGVHVPAAIWWPGIIDKNLKAYGKSNKYEGFISYLDIYPTIMAMSKQPLLGKNLDGINCLDGLLANKEVRPDMEDAMYWMWDDHGTVRTRRWKLIYSESARRDELYDLKNDIGEKKNVAKAHPAERDALVALYRKWLKDNNYAVSYARIDKQNISHSIPEPSGDLLEIKAVQTGPVKKPDNQGVGIRFSHGSGWDGTKLFLDTGDRIEFDIYVHKDSELARGCFYSPGKGWDQICNAKNGLNQDGIHFYKLDLPKGRWSRQIMGVGNYTPRTVPINYIMLGNRRAGYYHYSFDNIVIRSKDGSIKNLIWSSSENTINLVYRYNKKRYNSFEKVKAVKGFPFSSIKINVIQAKDVK